MVNISSNGRQLLLTLNGFINDKSLILTVNNFVNGKHFYKW